MLVEAEPQHEEEAGMTSSSVYVFREWIVCTNQPIGDPFLRDFPVSPVSAVVFSPFSFLVNHIAAQITVRQQELHLVLKMQTFRRSSSGNVEPESVFSKEEGHETFRGAPVAIDQWH